MLHNNAVRRLGAASVAAIAACSFLAAAPQASAAEPTCTNTTCDYRGPQGSGCFDDDLLSASKGGARLRYSPACHAFWAYVPNEPSSGSIEISLEMQRRVDGVWVDVERLFATQSVGDGPDWTNALGARNKSFRFRAIRNAPAPAVDDFTDWVRGGEQL